MTRGELTLEIAKRLQEIKDLYLRECPDGNCLSLKIFKDSISFNNIYWVGGKDKDYPIDYYENEKRICVNKEWKDK